MCKEGFGCYKGYGTESKAECDATCKGPGPKPNPPNSTDSWQNYVVAGMNVLSVTGGKDPHAYEKVVILLHGGGGQGTDWEYNYEEGWFGNMTGIKYVFPTSVLPGHVWYNSFKNGCGLIGDCAYNISSIHESATNIAGLIDYEKAMVNNVNKNVFLAGFSEGAQLSSYMQFVHLTFALGGVIVMDGFPLPPLSDMPAANGGTPAAAKANASYTGDDMRWMIWEGSNDPIFPAKLTMDNYHGIFDILGVADTWKIEHTEPGMTHTVIESEFAQMVQFIRQD